MRILIAEDRYDDRYLLETILGLVGYEYVSAEDGLAALEQLQKGHFDLIMSDILMTDMDGYELCMKVKQDERLKHIPFIFVTATYLTGADEKFALSLGADLFIKKPINQELVYTTIAELDHAVKSGQYIPKTPISVKRFSKDHLLRIMESMENKTLELEALHNKQIKTEKALRQSKNRYRTISSQASDYFYQALILGNDRMELTWLAGGFEKITGYDMNRFKNYNDLLEIVVEDDRSIFIHHLQNYHTLEEVKCQYRIQTKGGSKKWIEDSYHTTIDEKTKQTTGIIGCVKDISIQKLYEAELKLVATVVASAAESIVITDPKGNIEYVNPAFEKTSGYSKTEITGQNPRILKSGFHDPEYYHTMWETILQGKTWKGTFVNKKKDGTKYEVSGSIQPIKDSTGKIRNFVAVRRDVTHEKYLESQLRQTQKMESLGMLAGGIAHDFNNILTAIIGFTELNIGTAKDDSELKEDLTEILSAANRARQLVKQILTFARKADSEFEPFRLSLIVKESAGLLRASIPSTINIRLNINSDAMINGDPSQIHQTIMNLYTNAFHAIGSREGKILIALNEIMVNKDFLIRHPELQIGPHIMLEIQDTGCGMSEKTMSRIFDPFFTTKDVNQGTGLGLSTVFGIVQSHSGSIRVYSELNQGSKFTIILPVTEGDSSAHIHDEDDIPRGNEKILVIDDEITITKLSSRILKSLGYDVVTVNNITDTLEIFRSEPYAFDLVITDLAMPKMSGIKLSKEIISIRKDIPIILCSGYSNELSEKDLKAHGIKMSLNKPINKNTLAITVRKVLDRRNKNQGTER